MIYLKLKHKSKISLIFFITNLKFNRKNLNKNYIKIDRFFYETHYDEIYDKQLKNAWYFNIHTCIK